MQEETNDVNLDSSPEEVVEEVVEETLSEETIESAPKAETMVPTSRLKLEADRRRAVEKELERLKKQPTRVINKALDVDDYIDISASLEGLDAKEKQFLAEQHKLSGKSLREIRNDENFLLWQQAYKQKVEKEKALSPSNKQSETDRPKPFIERLKKASLEDQEKLLVERGLYKQPRPRADRTRIGGM